MLPTKFKNIYSKYNFISDADENVIVNFEDFQNATKKFMPSLSKSDMEYFNKLKSQFDHTQKK